MLKTQTNYRVGKQNSFVELYRWKEDRFFSYFKWIRLDKLGTSRCIKVKLVIAFLYISNNVSKIKLLVLILNIGIFFPFNFFLARKQILHI